MQSQEVWDAGDAGGEIKLRLRPAAGSKNLTSAQEATYVLVAAHIFALSGKFALRPSVMTPLVSKDLAMY